MKIGFLLQDTGAIYGAEQATLDLAAGLVAQPGVSVAWFLIEEQRVKASDRTLREAAGAIGEGITGLPTRRRFSRALIRDLRAAVAGQAVDVLHCVGPKANLHGCLALRRGRPVPMVATVHGWLKRFVPREWLYTQVEKWVFRRCSALIVLSRYYEQVLAGVGVPPERLHRIPSGLDATTLAGRGDVAAAWPAPDPFTLGVLARFTEEKNHALLVEAARRLWDEGVAVRWIFAGDGKEWRRIRHRVTALGLDDVIALPGRIDRRIFFPQVHALVQASRLENLPYSILEAMAWCRPVIATNTGGIPDLVVPGETGVLVPVNDADAVVDAVRTLVNDLERARDMGRAGRHRLEQHFSPGAFLDRHLALYRQLISDRKTR